MLPGEIKYPSSSQFNFQLTEKAIGSPLLRRQPSTQSRLSLQYTLSQISIENELDDQVPGLDVDCLPYSSLKDHCGYATASTRHTLTSAVKSTLQAIRIRTHSCRKHNSAQKMRATIAVYPIKFNDPTNMDLTNRRRDDSKEKFRLRKSISVRDRKNSENLPHLENRFVLESREAEAKREGLIGKAFKVKTISLQQNEARGKVYMKKLIQNRASILHLSDTCELFPFTTKKIGFRM